MFHPKGPTFLELARQALSSTERGYDLLAGKFDYTPFRTPGPVLEASAPFIGRVDRALDLCCGTGAAIEMLRPLCRERVVGVDFSLGMLEEARRRLASAGGDAELRFVHRDVLEMEDEAEHDVVTCFGACGHFLRRDQPRLIDRVYRALRPGGRFVFASAYLPKPWSWKLWLAALFDVSIVVRNVLWRPPFHMYYLGFLLPRARRLLEARGFEVEEHMGFCASYPRLCLVVATRPE